MSPEAPATASERRGSVATSDDPRPACCPYYHEAVELIGRRWTGAIVAVLLAGGAPARQRDLARRPRAQRPARVRAHEGARGARRRDAARRSRPAGEGPLRADRHGPVARARARRAEVVGAPLAACREAARGALALSPRAGAAGVAGRSAGVAGRSGG